MGRIFRNGELQEAILNLLSQNHPLNGYTIMQNLAAELSGNWRPSPGSIYPALLGLEDAKMIKAVDVNGTKMYELDDLGVDIAEHSTVLETIKERTSKNAHKKQTVGDLITNFLKTTPYRRVTLDNEEKQIVDDLLDSLNNRFMDLFGSRN